jgi:monoamine oxidase
MYLDLSIPEKAEVVIVGGGISGIYTALRYLQLFPNARNSVVLLEASSTLGGRLQTYYSKNHKHTSFYPYQYEIGGSRFNQHHRKWIALVKKYDCTMVPITSQKSLCQINAMDTHPSTSSLMPSTFKHAPAHYLKNVTFGEYLETYYSKIERQLFQTQFGYDGEFDIMNAYDAIRIFERDFSEKSHYFMVKEGMSEMIKRIKEDLIRKGCFIYTKCPVTRFESNASSFSIYTTYHASKPIQASKVFFALPKKALLEFDVFKESTWINAVEGIPLQRVYAQFTPSSTYLDTRTTTNLPLRQYIPVNPPMKIAMISYSDTRYATEWHQKYEKDSKECKKEYLRQLKHIYDQCSSSNSNSTFALKWLRPYYWESGVHVWKKHADSLKMHVKARIPFGRRVPCFIVGEAYSMHQGWIEGALETVDEVFEKYL